MIRIDVSKQFHSFKVDVNLTIQQKESLVIIGPSGCGKSTLLNMIAGFMSPDTGAIHVADKVYFSVDKGVNLPIHTRKIGYVHQEGLLFEHLSVLDNLRYGQRDKRDKNEEQLQSFIEIFHLEQCLDRSIKELSGGEKQRVAIIRALMSSPEILLFDEIFSALDRVMRHRLRAELNLLKDILSIPMVFVTHDLADAYELADRVAYMDNGKIVEVGTVQKMFYTPDIRGTAEFLGHQNIFSLTEWIFSLDVDQSFTHIIVPDDSITLCLEEQLGAIKATIHDVEDYRMKQKIEVVVARMQGSIIKEIVKNSDSESYIKGMNCWIVFDVDKFVYLRNE